MFNPRVEVADMSKLVVPTWLQVGAKIRLFWFSPTSRVRGDNVGMTEILVRDHISDFLSFIRTELWPFIKCNRVHIA